eukprot:gene5514-6199_t
MSANSKKRLEDALKEGRKISGNVEDDEKGEAKSPIEDVQQFKVGNENGVFSVQISPNGTAATVGLGSGSIQLFSIEKLDRIRKLLPGSYIGLPVTALKFYPTATKNVLYAASADSSISVWDLDTFAHQSSIDEPGNQINALDFTSDGISFATAGKDKDVRLYDSETLALKKRYNGVDLLAVESDEQISAESGHCRKILALRFHPEDKDILLTAGWDHSVKIWDIRTEGVVRTIRGPFVCGDGLDVLGDEILTGSWLAKEALQIWDYGSGKLIEGIPFPVVGHQGEFLYCSRFWDSQTIVAGGSGSNDVKILNRENKQAYLEAMFPVRKELVGKRFAYLLNETRRKRERRSTRHASEIQTSENLSWLTGTIVASNVEEIDVVNGPGLAKETKVYVEYDSWLKLPSEWLDISSGTFRVFLIEENLVLCKRDRSNTQRNHNWTALRMKGVVDNNFLVNYPNHVPIEYMGAKKQICLINQEDIIHHFPNKANSFIFILKSLEFLIFLERLRWDRSLLQESINQNSYLKSDYQAWERIQKTQMILLHGPYSLTGCRVEISSATNNRSYRAAIASHDCIDRLLDVMDDQMLKSRKINPRLRLINFLAPDDQIDRLMFGEAPRAIPTRLSRYGHQVYHPRNEVTSAESKLRRPNVMFTLPKWMDNNINAEAQSMPVMRQDHPSYKPIPIMPRGASESAQSNSQSHKASCSRVVPQSTQHVSNTTQVLERQLNQIACNIASLPQGNHRPRRPQLSKCPQVFQRQSGNYRRAASIPSEYAALNARLVRTNSSPVLVFHGTTDERNKAAAIGNRNISTSVEQLARALPNGANKNAYETSSKKPDIVDIAELRKNLNYYFNTHLNILRRAQSGHSCLKQFLNLPFDELENFKVLRTVLIEAESNVHLKENAAMQYQRYISAYLARIQALGSNEMSTFNKMYQQEIESQLRMHAKVFSGELCEGEYSSLQQNASLSDQDHNRKQLTMSLAKQVPTALSRQVPTGLVKQVPTQRKSGRIKRLLSLSRGNDEQDSVKIPLEQPNIDQSVIESKSNQGTDEKSFDVAHVLDGTDTSEIVANGVVSSLSVDDVSAQVAIAMVRSQHQVPRQEPTLGQDFCVPSETQWRGNCDNHLTVVNENDVAMRNEVAPLKDKVQAVVDKEVTERPLSPEFLMQKAETCKQKANVNGAKKQLEESKDAKKQLDASKDAKKQLEESKDAKKQLDASKDTKKQLEESKDAKKQLEESKDAKKQQAEAKDAKKQLDKAKDAKKPQDATKNAKRQLDAAKDAKKQLDESKALDKKQVQKESDLLDINVENLPAKLPEVLTSSIPVLPFSQDSTGNEEEHGKKPVRNMYGRTLYYMGTRTRQASNFAHQVRTDKITEQVSAQDVAEYEKTGANAVAHCQKEIPAIQQSYKSFEIISSVQCESPSAICSVEKSNESIKESIEIGSSERKGVDVSKKKKNDVRKLEKGDKKSQKCNKLPVATDSDVVKGKSCQVRPCCLKNELSNLVSSQDIGKAGSKLTTSARMVMKEPAVEFQNETSSGCKVDTSPKPVDVSNLTMLKEVKKSLHDGASSAMQADGSSQMGSVAVDSESKSQVTSVNSNSSLSTTDASVLQTTTSTAGHCSGLSAAPQNVNWNQLRRCFTITGKDTKHPLNDPQDSSTGFTTFSQETPVLDSQHAPSRVSSKRKLVIVNNKPYLVEGDRIRVIHAVHKPLVINPAGHSNAAKSTTVQSDKETNHIQQLKSTPTAATSISSNPSALATTNLHKLFQIMPKCSGISTSNTASQAANTRQSVIVPLQSGFNFTSTSSVITSTICTGQTPGNENVAKIVERILKTLQQAQSGKVEATGKTTVGAKNRNATGTRKGKAKSIAKKSKLKPDDKSNERLLNDQPLIESVREEKHPHEKGTVLALSIDEGSGVNRDKDSTMTVCNQIGNEDVVTKEAVAALDKTMPVSNEAKVDCSDVRSQGRKRLRRRKDIITNDVTQQASFIPTEFDFSARGRSSRKSIKTQPLDYCPLHSNLSCEKCLPFKEQDGEWPDKTRRKDVTAAWKRFFTRCQQHSVAKCTKCQYFREYATTDDDEKPQISIENQNIEKSSVAKDSVCPATEDDQVLLPAAKKERDFPVDNKDAPVLDLKSGKELVSTAVEEEKALPIVMEEEHTPRAVVEEDQVLRASKEDKQAASTAVEEEKGLPIVMEEEQTPRAVVEEDQVPRASEEDKQAVSGAMEEKKGLPIVMEEDQVLPASKDDKQAVSGVMEEEKGPPIVVEEEQTHRAVMEEDQVLRASKDDKKAVSDAVEEEKVPSIAMEEEQSSRAVVEEDQVLRASIDDKQAVSTAVEEEKVPPIVMEEEQTPRAVVEEDQVPRASKEDKQAVSGAMEEEKGLPIVMEEDQVLPASKDDKQAVSDAVEEEKVPSIVMEEEQSSRAVVEEDQVLRASIDDKQAVSTAVEEEKVPPIVMKEEQTPRAVVEEDQVPRASEEDKQAVSGAMEEEKGLPIVMEEDQVLPASKDDKQAVSGVMEEEKGPPIVVEEEQTHRAVMEEDQVLRASKDDKKAVSNAVEEEKVPSIVMEEEQAYRAVMEEDQVPRASEEDKQAVSGAMEKEKVPPIVMEEEQTPRAVVEEVHVLRASKDDKQAASCAVEEEMLWKIVIEEEQTSRVFMEEDQVSRASKEDKQAVSGAMEGEKVPPAVVEEVQVPRASEEDKQAASSALEAEKDLRTAAEEKQAPKQTKNVLGNDLKMSDDEIKTEEVDDNTLEDVCKRHGYGKEPNHLPIRIPHEKVKISTRKTKRIPKKRRRFGSSSSSEDEEEDRRTSVSLNGRIRNKVRRPGTVDISKLGDDFMEVKRRKKDRLKVGTPAKSFENKCEDENNLKTKRKRGRPVKNFDSNMEAVKEKKIRLDNEDQGAPREGNEEKSLVEMVKAGSLKIINVEELKDLIIADPPAATNEAGECDEMFARLIEKVGKINVKYLAISKDDSTKGDNTSHVDELKIENSEEISSPGAQFNDKLSSEFRDLGEYSEHSNLTAAERNCNRTSSDEYSATASINEHAIHSEGQSSIGLSKSIIDMIIEKVDMVAKAAKQQKEAESTKKRRRSRKKSLTVAQVLAIKRNNVDTSNNVFNKRVTEDLKMMLTESEKRGIALNTMIDEAATKKEKETRPRRRRKRQSCKRDTFLQEGNCDQTPKLPKCRDCKIIDKRNSDLNVFCCRFTMFRRLRKLKTGKLESAGFCSPESALQDSFFPWVSKADDIKLDANVCYYILTNVAGQFASVVEDECDAMFQGTHDGAIGWKRPVPGIREMCDACATTIFNIHWVCEKCGFGVCLDCFRSKLWESSTQNDESAKTFEFRWFNCAPGLGHKPQKLTITQIIPKSALWELCLEMIDVCNQMNIPFKLSENMLIQGRNRSNELSGSKTFRMSNKEIQETVSSSLYSDEAQSSLASQDRLMNAQSFEMESSNDGKQIIKGSQVEKIAVERGDVSAINESTFSHVAGKSSSAAVSTNHVNSTGEATIYPIVNGRVTTSLLNGDSTECCKQNGSVVSLCSQSKKNKIDSYYHKVCNNVGCIAQSINKWRNDSEHMPRATYAFDVENKEDSVEGGIADSRAEQNVIDTQTNVKSNENTNSNEFDDNMDDKEECELMKDNKIRSFSNSLDILAMVASGFLNKNDCVESSDNSQDSTDLAPTKRLSVNEVAYEGLPVASYLCDGSLLQLNHPKHPDNVRLFRDVWRKGEPLIVSHVDKLLSKELWSPELFAQEFGHEEADVVNCRSGLTLTSFSVGDFWKGFESVKDRPVDSNGDAMLLKLKDWPPGADFGDKMPERLEDLMNAFPLPEYTRRDGDFNLVSRLPADHSIKPDLGPKMYNAYGSAAVPSAGTTNLHIDMSDAVNVMVYVGIPKDPFLGEKEVLDALYTIDVACCSNTRDRVRKNILPGALWHIFAAEDSDKIRQLLRKVAEERGMEYTVYGDPIHDQSFYLDYDLRKRLKDEFGVSGWAVCQCLGDAVFIPAGAPHQVLNLHSCVKVAEDFVSPELVSQLLIRGECGPPTAQGFTKQLQASTTAEGFTKHRQTLQSKFKVSPGSKRFQQLSKVSLSMFKVSPSTERFHQQETKATG